MSTERPELQTTWFPFDHVMAVIDYAGEAEKAVKELRDVGFHAEDVQLLREGEAAERLDVTCEHCNLVKRLARWLWSFGTVEGMTLSQYASEGKAGHQIVGVHIHQPADVEQVEKILKSHQAHHVEHFGHAGGVTEVTGY